MGCGKEIGVKLRLEGDTHNTIFPQTPMTSELNLLPGAPHIVGGNWPAVV